MTELAEVMELAESLQANISLIVRRLRPLPGDNDLSSPQRATLSRLDRSGPATSAELARAEGMTPQSMHAIIAALEARELVGREPDPHDGRRVVMSVTGGGRELLRGGWDARTERLARALVELEPEEVGRMAELLPLLQRVAASL